MKRRDFLNGLMVGAAALGTSAALRPMRSLAQDSAVKTSPAPRRLSVGYRTIDIKGRSARVFGLVQPDGTSGLALDAGTEFDVALSSSIDELTLIHWHGLTPPWAADGVPDNPAALLRPSETRRYTFPVGAGGTHWMHAHTLQEQNLLAAPLIVRTADDLKRDEQEVVVLLHDFSFLPAEELLGKLKGNAAPGAMPMDHGAMRGMGGMQHMMSGNDMAGVAMPGAAAMDLNDIDYDAYLANDRTLDDPEVVKVEKGGRVRLRIINGATATAFTIDIGGLSGELIAVDGQGIEPIVGTSFPVAMGQRLDIRVSLPREGGAFPILALREGAVDRTGIVLATAGADVRRIPAAGDAKGPILGLDLEQRLRPIGPFASRAADRRFELSLTGDMAAYTWGIDGADGLVVKRGERIEVTIANASMMAHPMHLHGHHFQVVAINGTPIAGAVRDTVLLPPMASVVLAFDADNPGRWPLHCHHLYHMATGMMAYVTYDGIG